MRPMILVAVVWLGLMAPVMTWAADAADSESGPHLRNWYLAIEGVSTWKDRYDVFGLPEFPSGVVEEPGRGTGLRFGRRFGDRFLLSAKTIWARHEEQESNETITDVEVLITGTVMFRERNTFQPFLRGGVGGGGEYLDLATDGGHVFAFGAAVLAGGGLQVRLSSRFSLELAGVATFSNFLEINDNSDGDLWPEESWQVRVSNWGWRTSSGIVFWF